MIKNEELWQLRDVKRKLEAIESDISRVVSFLEELIDNEDVTEEMVRYFTGPVDEIERRVGNIVEDVENYEK